MAIATLMAISWFAKLSDSGTQRARRLAEKAPECAFVDASSSAWRQDPNAEEAYQRQIEMNPDAEPFHPCLNRKCFSYKFKVAKWQPFQLISLTWHEMIQVDAIYGADMAPGSEGAISSSPSWC